MLSIFLEVCSPKLATDLTQDNLFFEHCVHCNPVYGCEGGQSVDSSQYVMSMPSIHLSI